MQEYVVAPQIETQFMRPSHPKAYFHARKTASDQVVLPVHSINFLMKKMMPNVNVVG